MRASFSGVSPVWKRRRREESCGSLVTAQASAWVDVPTAPHFFAVRTDQGVQHPTRVCKRYFHENAWICARRTTDRDLESQRHEKVNARPTTHHDLASVILDKKKESIICRFIFRMDKLCGNSATFLFQNYQKIVIISCEMVPQHGAFQ